jgi:hypothetical protein
MDSKCFKTRHCKNCVRATCSKYLNELNYVKILDAGAQGIALLATNSKKKEVVVKFSVVNESGATLGLNNNNNVVCSRVFLNIPGMKTLTRKFANITDSFARTDSQFMEEANVSQKMSDYKIGPHVYHIGLCKDGLDTKLGTYSIGFIVMEKMDETMDSAIEKYKKGEMTLKHMRTIIKKLRELQRNPNSLKIAHQDLHLFNLMLKEKNRKIDVKIIDFGLVTESGQESLVYEIEEVVNFIKRIVYQKEKILILN